MICSRGKRGGALRSGACKGSVVSYSDVSGVTWLSGGSSEAGRLGQKLRVARLEKVIALIHQRDSLPVGQLERQVCIGFENGTSWSRGAKQMVRRAMYEKGKSFLGAALLLRKHGGSGRRDFF